MRITLAVFLLCSSLIYGQTRLKVVIHSKVGYEGLESFADSAAKKLESVLNSNEFREAILTCTFTEAHSLSNQKIYALIMRADQKGILKDDTCVVDLRLRVVTRKHDGKRWEKYCKIDSNAGTIGIDGGGSGVIATCPDWLNEWHRTSNYAELAGHYAHEYIHSLGFSHFIKRKKSSSIPYQVGEIVERIMRISKYKPM